MDNEFSVQLKNVITGFFGNANTMYYLAPQLLKSGTVQGHCHVVAQILDDNPNQVPDPQKFQFFKGIETVAEPGTNVSFLYLGLSYQLYYRLLAPILKRVHLLWMVYIDFALLQEATLINLFFQGL